jgi:hypothetical protein
MKLYVDHVNMIWDVNIITIDIVCKASIENFVFSCIYIQTKT